MKMPTTWNGWATRVSLYVREGKRLLGEPRFPIKIAEIARDYTRNVFPGDPITHVEGKNFKGRFEGALVPNDALEWGIFYDTGHTSKGRINFTLAHELGHYLAHRHLSGEPMGNVTTIGLDFAKSVFQVHAVDAAGEIVVRRKLTRGRVLAFFESLPRCLVGIEALQLVTLLGSRAHPTWS